MEEKKAKRILFGTSSAREKDMISNLPESLISEILSYLTTEDAVRTSVLSSRWKGLWLLIPGLDLDSYDFPDYSSFVSFVDRFLDFAREEKSCVHKLKLTIQKNVNVQSCVTRWIDFVATRKLKHLDVEYFVKRKCLEVMPVSLFTCETLLCLSLRQVLVGNLGELSVSLPRLKNMTLELNIYANERSLESLISTCHVLEDLSIYRWQDDNVKVLRVRSQSLISLSIQYHDRCWDSEEGVTIDKRDHFSFAQLGVSIDASRLKYLTFDHERSYSKTIINSGSLTKVNIFGSFDLSESDDQVFKIFTSFSGVRDLKISFSFFWYIERTVQLPKFCNMCCLEAEISFDFVGPLLRFLARCPNLKSLILDVCTTYVSYVCEQIRVSPMPLCLRSSLESVEIKCSCNRNFTVELARYFAENSVILKKLVLRSSGENPVVLSDILALPRQSSSCQILVC